MIVDEVLRPSSSAQWDVFKASEPKSFFAICKPTHRFIPSQSKAIHILTDPMKTNLEQFFKEKKNQPFTNF